MIPLSKPIIEWIDIDAVVKVMRSGQLACGEVVQRFEEQFAKSVGTKYAVATNSGTAALHIMLRALGVGPGDEVITTPFTFVATGNAIRMCGATPVFSDISPGSYNLNPFEIEDKITDKTKLILPVHLYGRAAHIRMLTRIGKKNDIEISYDACQAQGATYDSQPVGSFGAAECFSFYPTKNMTTGEGGMVTTNDTVLCERMQSLRNHGRTEFGFAELGYNYRMTDIAAAIGIEQLKRLPAYIYRRRQNANYYDFILDTPGHSYHQYTVSPQNRNKFIKELHSNGIGTGVYYPKLLTDYPQFYQYSNCPNAEYAKDHVLSIPVRPDLTVEETQKIKKVIEKCDA
jgi:dTDP-4-amino-4,6-dideoxygalactose transaminase